MDLQAIKQAAATYGPAMTKFLREIVAFPGESAEEKDHVKRIEQEMKDLGFDEVEVDPMGNILGYMGTGKPSLPLMDILIQLVLAIVTIGILIHMMVSKTKLKLVAVAYLTNWVVSYPLYTALRL